MSELAEVISDLSRRLQTLELRKTQREVDEIARHIEQLESSRRVDRLAKSSDGV